ncbi:hypothetical protein STEG23_023001 [Scotinomys teguina]
MWDKLDDFKYFLQLHNKLPITLLHFVSEPVFECINGLPADLAHKNIRSFEMSPKHFRRFPRDGFYFDTVLKDELIHELKQTLNAIKLEEKGVYVQASTLGSLEALLEFLKTSEVPYAGINIGPVHKKDIMKASVMLEHDPQYAVILAFDVRIKRDAQEMADSLGVRIFSVEIIYHLFDAFTKYRQDYKKQKQEEFKHIAVFPCKMKILPQYIFNSRDPIVIGVTVEAGQVKQGTPMCVPSKNFVDIGIVASIEINHKQTCRAFDEGKGAYGDTSVTLADHSGPVVYIQWYSIIPHDVYWVSAIQTCDARSWYVRDIRIYLPEELDQAYSVSFSPALF